MLNLSEHHDILENVEFSIWWKVGLILNILPQILPSLFVHKIAIKYQWPLLKSVCQVLVWHTLSDTCGSIETVHTRDSTSIGTETGIHNSYDSNLS
jgi:hypothetical protein